MPVDVFLDARARSFLTALSAAEQARVQAVLDGLMADPYPDERNKVRLPFPFRYGTIACVSDGFFIVYEFENATTLRVSTISRYTGQYWG